MFGFNREHGVPEDPHAWLRPRPFLGERLLNPKPRPAAVPVIPGQDGAAPAGSTASASRLAACGACGCSDTARSSRLVPGGEHDLIMLSILCDDVTLCVRTYRAGMTAARYGAFLRTGEAL